MPGVVLDNARLVVTELVTNSIVHGIREGKGWVDVTIERRPLCLRIEVADPASATACVRCCGRSGRGAHRGGGCSWSTGSRAEWGVDTGAGTRVWCELAT